ncbi:MAG: hypothetical protein AAF515_08795 [Pseudomonadota bacterium]
MTGVNAFLAMVFGARVRPTQAVVRAAIGGLLAGGLCLPQAAWADPDFDVEGDAPGAAPGAWNVTAVDEVVVTDAEGAADFTFYSVSGIEVAPNRSANMIRLGMPAARGDRAPAGSTRITSSFVPTSAEISFALRLLSHEHRGRRDRDVVRIDVDDGLGGTFAVGNGMGAALDLPNPASRAKPLTCGATPCAMSIDVGGSSDFLDTDWQRVSISGLPTDGTTVTLTIELDTADDRRPSWLYIDATAGTFASLSFNPGQMDNSVVLEGDVVAFDCTASATTNGRSCTWEVSGAGLAPTTLAGDYALVSFPDNGTPSVQLTVDDGSESFIAMTGVGDTPALVIENAPPLASAGDVEIPEGGSGEIVCRYLDPGVNDTHTVDISVGNSLTITRQQTEDVPTLASGIAAATFDASGLSPGDYSGTCVVTDSDGASASAGFTVAVISAAELDARAGIAGASTAATGAGIAGAVPLPVGSTRLGTLADQDDIAVFEIRGPNGGALPVGGEVLLTLTTPADYDLVAFVTSSDSNVEVAPWVSAPFVSAPFVSAPFVSLPFVSVPFVSAPFVSLPFVSAPFVSLPFVSAPFVSLPFVSLPFVSAPLATSPWVSADFEFSDFPLSQLAGGMPDGSNISAIDLNYGDLGALNIGALADDPIRVKAISASLGTATERLLLQIGPGETGLFVAVVPHESDTVTGAPFSLRVEGSAPADRDELYAEACDGETLVGGDIASTESVVELVSQASPKTLIVTSRERMRATHGMSAMEFDQFISDMQPFFNHPAVMARVISLPSAIYDDADRMPCSIEVQNALASEIREFIQAQLAGSSIEYVQLMGSLDIIPPYFTPDETVTGNERLFASDLLVKIGTALATAIAEGYNLTDAFYVDAVPQPFRGRFLYLEDVSIARMVETPADMLTAAAKFVANDGVLSLLSVQTSGYDFFIDGTEDVNRVLSANLNVPLETLNNNTWTAAELRCQFLGIGDDCSGEVAALSVVNAHFSYNGLLTAAGFFSDDPLEIVRSSESAGLLSGLVLSIGCHSALTVPDAWALLDLPGVPNSARDWVQEMGSWVGSMNFAYGDTEVSDRGTEGLITLIVAFLTDGETLGKAIIKAKWQYGLGQFDFGEYDEKSMIGLTGFGMPQYTIDESIQTGAGEGAEGGDTGTPVGTLALTIIEEGANSVETFPISQVSASTGSYFTYEGGAQGVPGRPLLPTKRVFQLRPVGEGETKVHGVVVRGGTYEDFLDQDPVFSVMQTDWNSGVGEPNPCVNALVPVVIGAVTTFDGGGDTLQSFTFQGGQFQCTQPGNLQGSGPVTGTTRVYDQATVELAHPSMPEFDDDYESPVVIEQTITRDPMTGDAVVTLDATDNIGIREIVALIYMDLDGVEGGPGMVTSVSTGMLMGAPGPYVLTLPGAASKPLAFQYVDLAGNVTVKTLKGGLYRPLAQFDCSDPIGDTGEPGEDIVSCSATSSGTRVTVDVHYAGNVPRSVTEYGLRLQPSRRWIRWFSNQVDAAGFLDASVTEIGPNSLRFSFDAGDPRIGWDGMSEFAFELRTRRFMSDECGVTSAVGARPSEGCCYDECCEYCDETPSGVVPTDAPTDALPAWGSGGTFRSRDSTEVYVFEPQP